MDLENLKIIAEEHQDELREYRLTGDLNWLLPIFSALFILENSTDINKISQDFFNALTDNENKAYQAIKQEIGSSGNISIVKMIQKTNLSRPVWTSLLQKMEKFGIAQITNQGVKGTKINFKMEITNE